MEQPAPMPEVDTMLRAVMERDPSFEGIFVFGVRTTGVFCRPTCPARKPRRENVVFFPRAGDALASGYRPCQRCRPMEPAGGFPPWLEALLSAVAKDPGRRWSTQDLLDAGIEPARVRRWFQSNYGMTFLAYLRALRLGRAFSRLQDGEGVVDAALESGFDSLSGFCDAFRRSTGLSPSMAGGQRRLSVAQFSSPLGPLVAAADDEAVFLLEFWDRRMLETQFEVLRRLAGAVFFPGRNRVLDQLEAELAHYFEGGRQSFATPLRLPGSEHQRQVWQALRGVPRGATWTYGELARRVGRPRAVRAVARAVGENRLAIVVPCHRIVGHDGRLTGYGGGLWRKRFLLALEGVCDAAGGNGGRSSQLELSM